MGGLARKSTIINQNKADGYNLLVADAGNLFFKKEHTHVLNGSKQVVERMGGVNMVKENKQAGRQKHI